MKSLLVIVSIISLITTFSFMTVAPSRLKERIALGKRLFSEKILSKDSSLSCASCHKPAFAFADTVAYSIGINGKLASRNTPSVLNMKNRPYFFWDGRANSLETQALIPIANPDEMALPVKEAIVRLNRSAEYRKLFKKVFNQLPNANNLGAAFSAYERTLETVDSKFDDWSNDMGELTEAEERGRQLFIGEKAHCFDCHSMEDFTDDDFKNIGLFNRRYMTDSGRFRVTKKKTDLGKFKTPGLRNVAVTPPYMHNGMFSTLEDVVRYYNDPRQFVKNPVNIDPVLMKQLHLTDQEQKDLVSFLKTLTDKAYIKK